MSSKTRVLVVGTGGIGTLAALNLERGGLAEVSCVLRSSYATVLDRGFQINSCDHGVIQNWRPTEILNIVPSVTAGDRSFQYIVCCTKNVPDAAPSLCDIIAPGITSGYTVVVLIQNGLNIEKQFISRFPDNIVLSGVSRTDAHEVTPGVIEQKQKDNLRIGAFNNARLPIDDQRRAAEQFVNIYNASERTACSYEIDVSRDRWSKLVYNATLNPVCALTGVNTGDLHLTKCAFNGLVIPAMKEVVQVSKAKGISLPEDIIQDTILSNPIDKKISPSMQLDLQKGNLIEHENIIGEVIREAKTMGVATPILCTLYGLCSLVQAKTKRYKGLE